MSGFPPYFFLQMPQLKQDHPENELPLSWLRQPAAQPDVRELRLRLSRYRWLFFVDLPDGQTFREFYRTQLEHREKIYLRGCPPPIADFLAKNKWQTLPNGSEALLNLRGNHFDKRSLRELVRRGNRWGSAAEIAISTENAGKFAALQVHSRHGLEPQLRYLFRSDLLSGQRCFVFQTQQKQWLGAALLTESSPGNWHTELILKARKSPAGIMEALFAAIFEQLRDEGHFRWSLGEAPFFYTAPPICRTAKLVKFAGQTVRFAYDYRGLYRFKNKFLPEWRPVFLCGKPEVSVALLADLFIQTRLLQLVAFSAGRRMVLPFRKT